MHARVVGSLPLRYAAAADTALDGPAHVRGASAIVVAGARLVVLRHLGLHGSDERVAVGLRGASTFSMPLRHAGEFAGSESNVEAAVRIDAADGGVLRRFNRGNGAPAGGTPAVDATCEVSWPELAAYLAGESSGPPIPRDIVQYELGSIGGQRLTFTGATPPRLPRCRAAPTSGLAEFSTRRPRRPRPTPRATVPLRGVPWA